MPYKKPLFNYDEDSSFMHDFKKRMVINNSQQYYYINGEFLFDWTEQQSNKVNWMLKKLYLLNSNLITKVKENIKDNKQDYLTWLRATSHIYCETVFSQIEHVINKSDINLNKYMHTASQNRKYIQTQKQYDDIQNILQKYINDNKFKIALINVENNKIKIDFGNILNKVIKANDNWDLAETVHYSLLYMFEELFLVEDKSLFVNIFTNIKNTLNKYENMDNINITEYRNLSQNIIKQLKHVLKEDMFNVEKNGGRI